MGKFSGRVKRMETQTLCDGLKSARRVQCSKWEVKFKEYFALNYADLKWDSCRPVNPLVLQNDIKI